MISRFPSAQIIDLAHQIPSFDILESAYVVKNSFHAFPPGSVHLIVVDPEYGETPTGVVMQYEGHLFVAPDNGILSLIANGAPRECFLIENTALFDIKYPRSFRAAGILAPVAAFLASGGELEEIGNSCSIRELLWGEPTTTSSALRGKIIYIDKFGNAVTNITKKEFLRTKSDRGFELYIRNIRLKRIVTTYSDVGKADVLAIFGEGDYLEIAMREASAAELLGLKVNDMVTIEFKEVAL